MLYKHHDYITHKCDFKGLLFIVVITIVQCVKPPRRDQPLYKDQNLMARPRCGLFLEVYLYTVNEQVRTCIMKKKLAH